MQYTMKKTPKEALLAGYEGAKQGLAYSTGLKAVHGRPAYFGEKTIGMQDGGATVGMLFIQSICKAYKIV